MSEWVRALGIDHGTVRIGLAVSDDLGMLAHPVETVAATPPSSALDRIETIVREREIEDVIVGLPLHTNGKAGSAVERSRAFLVTLRERLGDAIRFHEVDERFSTKTAREKLEQTGRAGRDPKKVIDQAAAVEILQEWLDGRAGAGLPDGEPLPDREPRRARRR